MDSSSRRRAPTIIDIARETGVSKSAVSLALRGADGVSDETRQRIQEAADRLGYRSNAIARALVQGRTMQIGVVATDLRNPYHVEVTLGVEAVASQHDLTAIIAHGERSSERIEQHLEAMLSLSVEGIVVVGSRISADVMSRVSTQVPLVVVGRPGEVPVGIDTVANNDAAGARLAVEHLHELGHHSLAFVSRSDSPAALARIEGFTDTVRSTGGEPCVRRCTDDELFATMDELRREGVTAVVTNNDLTAVAVLDWAHGRELSIPNELSLVGYDDSLLARTVTPRLTSVDQATDRLGAEAMTLLHDRLAGRAGRARRRVLEPILQIRASSTPPG